MKPRLPQSLVLHRERYAAAGEMPEIAAYDGRLATYSAAQGMGALDWTQRMLARVGTAAALNGRHRMQDALTALGFKLR